jgi:hypothetical protein
MPFLDEKPKMLSALTRVPTQGAVNQAAVNQFVEILDKELSDAFSFTSSGSTVFMNIIGAEDAYVRFAFAFGPPDAPAGTINFSIQMRSPTTHAWVNKVTYSQT